VLGDKTAAATARGFGLLLIWARGLDCERVWALEDCRHVSGGLERFLIARGERVVRVSTRLMAGSRRSSRERGSLIGSTPSRSPRPPWPPGSRRCRPPRSRARNWLDRGGNRQINAAIHRIAITRARCHPETRDHIARKQAEGKTTRDAIRCLKRHLTRRIWHLLQPPSPIPNQTITRTSLTYEQQMR